MSVTISDVGTEYLIAADGTGTTSIEISAASVVVDGRLTSMRGNPLKQVISSNIPIGDSITQGSSAESAGLWQFGNTGAEKGAWRAGVRLISNAGIAGQTSSQIQSRFASDVVAHYPDSTTIGAGTNDQTIGTFGAAGGATYLNYIEQMVAAALTAGIQPILVAPPVKDSVPDSYYNRFFYYMMAEYYGIPLIDYCNFTMDPTTGNYISGYSSDGVHPNAPVINLMANRLRDIFNSPYANNRLPYFALFPESAQGQPSNMIQNGNFVDIGLGLPISWGTNTTNATYSFVANTTYPYNGNTLVYTKTDSALVYALTSGTASVTDGDFVVGDTIRLSGVVTTAGLTAGSGNGVFIQVTFDTGDNQYVDYASDLNETIVFSHELVVPTSATSFTLNLLCDAPGTYSFANLTMINVSKYRAMWQPGQQAL